MLLIGLPLISWYFLQSGLEWRRAKVSDLKSKGLFLNSFDFTTEDKNALYELMAHRTSIVKLKEAVDAQDEIIIDQFDNTHTFQFVSFEKTEMTSNGWSSKSALKYFKPNSQNCIPAEMRESMYMIVDTAGLIRQYYLDNAEKTMGTLIEDVAVILPRKKPKDIVIKKDTE